MKKLLLSIVAGFYAMHSFAQNPATDRDPAKHNYDNPLKYCTTGQCGGIAKIEWEMDCIMGCAKAGDTFLDMSETDCNGAKQSAYDVMSNGKPLLILWEGWDCGNCRSAATKVSDYIIKNKDKFNFWMPYGGIGGGARCGASSDNRTPAEWQKSYPGFVNAFSFLDNDVTYIYGIHSLPHYTLIDPKTKKFVMITHQNQGNDPWAEWPLLPIN